MNSNNSSKWVRHHPAFESDKINPDLATSPWSGHRRFAYDLVTFMQPKTIVELGTHYGCSFFAFLQAAKDFSLDTQIYAVDTWRGDEHAGFYGEDVRNIVENTIGSFFPNQSTHLLRKLFDEALSDITDGSVELLHIDGFHSFDAAKHDFETWESKLASNAIVLFHDIAPSSGYGSAQYWSELKQKHPHFEFLHHSWGLGILFPKGDFWHRQIARSAPDGWEDFYRYQAQSELLAIQLSAAKAMIEERWDAMQSMETIIRERDATIAAAEAMARERWNAMKQMEAAAEERGQALQNLEERIHERDETVTALKRDNERLMSDIASAEREIERLQHITQNLSPLFRQFIRLLKK